MKIIFQSWREARLAIEQIKVQGTRHGMLFICQEGAFRDPTYNKEGDRTYNGWTSGTGRWFITDDLHAPDRCALNFRLTRRPDFEDTGFAPLEGHHSVGGW